MLIFNKQNLQKLKNDAFDQLGGMYTLVHKLFRKFDKVQKL